MIHDGHIGTGKNPFQYFSKRNLEKIEKYVMMIGLIYSNKAILI
jgi:hypothetical protein